MKFLALMLCVFCFSFSSFADIRCDGEHWVIDGVFLFTGGEKCVGRIATCDYVGTRSEGWYSYDKKNERHLGHSDCNLDMLEGYTPTCENIGTKSEGWYVAGSVVVWSRCANEEAVCGYRGTRHEGWYTYDKRTKKRIAWDMCSDSSY